MRRKFENLCLLEWFGSGRILYRFILPWFSGSMTAGKITELNSEKKINYSKIIKK